MKIFLSTLAVSLSALFAGYAALTTPASAETGRLNDIAYLAAARCVAYADLPQLQGDFFGAEELRQRVTTQSRFPPVRNRADDAAAHVRFEARDIRSEQGVARLRAARDQACASFIRTGLVQLERTSPAS